MWAQIASKVVPELPQTCKKERMTGRNIRFLVIAIVGCIACAFQAKRYRSVSDIALAIDIVDHLYVDNVDRAKLSEDALSGMISNLDPYSGYIPPEKVDVFRAQIEQNFAGIGVVISKTEAGPLKIARTIHNAPAEKAGLKVGELIISVDGHDLAPLTTDQASKLMRGAPNTSIRLGIRSADDDQTRDVEIRRAIIDTPSVVGDYRDTSGNTVYRMQADPRIAYIHMSVYGEHSAQEMEKFLTEQTKDAKAVIFDLRDNAGGLLDTARDICDMFLDSGTIVSTEGRVPDAGTLIEAEPGVLLPKEIPLIILMDAGSASASEVTAACLQDWGRAKIAGQRSYGKGSVQSVIDMDGGRARLRLTTAYWFSPKHRKIHRDLENKAQTQWGIDPDPELAVKLNDQERTFVFNRMFRRDSGELVPNPKLDAERDDEVEQKSEVELEKLGKEQTIARLRLADPSIIEDPQLLRVLCWLNEQWE